jgi:hypothetical protein
MFSGRKRFLLQPDNAIITQHTNYSTAAGFLKTEGLTLTRLSN